MIKKGTEELNGFERVLVMGYTERGEELSIGEEERTKKGR